MTQDQFIILAYKTIEIASVVTIAAFVACYSRWAHWWANPVGRTIVYKDIALLLVLFPSLLSAFVHLNWLTSHIVAWFDLAAFAAVPVIMVWRIVVWYRLHKAGMLTGNGGDSAEDPPHSPLYCSVDVSARQC